MSLDYVVKFNNIELPSWVKVQGITFSALPTLTDNTRNL